MTTLFPLQRSVCWHSQKGGRRVKGQPLPVPRSACGKWSLQWVSLRASSGQLGWHRGWFNPDGGEDSSLLQHTLCGSGCAAEPAQLLLPAHGSFSTNQWADIYQTPLAEAEVTVVGKFLQQLDQGTLKKVMLLNDTVQLCWFGTFLFNVYEN